MSWNWENFTSPDFGEAVKATEGCCLVPLGCLERHSTHLPVGTDMLFIHEVAERAAALEPAIVFPEYFLMQVHETKNFPGCIAIRHDLILSLLDNVCEEIARNGLKKIILLNGHGGNEFILPTFLWTMMEKQHDFTLYLIRLGQYLHPAMQDPEWKAMMVSEFDYHGGEMETSLALASFPELGRMDQMAESGLPLHRLPLPGVITATWWYADYPNQYAGDATHATAEKGEWMLNRLAGVVAELLAGIKQDTVTPALEKQFFSEIQH
jgi:creatinine amidohydrolase